MQFLGMRPPPLAAVVKNTETRSFVQLGSRKLSASLGLVLKGKPSDLSILPTRCPYVKNFVGYQVDTGKIRYVRVRCKRWCCAFCAEKNRRVLIKKMACGCPTRFITLTNIRKDFETPEQCLIRTRPLVTRLFAKIRRHIGPIEAAVVVEWTRRGWPHFHVLARGTYIPQKWLSEQWCKLSGAKVVDIRAINDPKKAIQYVAKYVTKAIQLRPKDMKLRTFSFTRGYLIAEETNPTGPEWRYERTHEHVSEVIGRLHLAYEISPKQWGYEFSPRDQHYEAFTAWMMDPNWP